MSKYICDKCGYIEENNVLSTDYTCPICNANKDNMRLLEEDAFSSNEIDAIINSVIEEAQTNKKENIINLDVEDKKVKIDEYNPAIYRINEKCINCGQCKKTCEKIVGLKYDLNQCKSPICIGCGQCIINCPTGALVPKYAYNEVKSLIDLNDKIVVALISPAVRVSIGEMFGIESGENSEKKLVTALKEYGFDYVFDTSFGADLTILEEVAEFASRLKDKNKLPLFTSCCPAWVKYAEIYHPELIDNISTCKSPIGMQCAIIKTYFCEQKGFDPNKVVTVAITPCTSKKMEAKEYTLNIDYVLTASEVGLMLKEENIKLNELSESNYDSMLSESSGAGVLFGASGGVCESAIRTLYRIMMKKNMDANQLVFQNLRGLDGIKEATIQIGEYQLRVAVVQQMENLEELLKDNKYKRYHFIEVMNCKGGCVGGGGQPLCPIPKSDEFKKMRSNGIYSIDQKRAVRFAHDNVEIKQLYKEYLKSPLSEKSLSLLHTSFSDKNNLLVDKN